ncbi:carboxymuconolactone decarboxylase [Sphingomonas sp. DBB INV C78]|uniref:carboxymuconolactone decarboxylase family protein n=1 Tax=Sphingomonas sp. DBB INV C78 TaxID=3349434 RepID=UPI0036D29667
MARVAIPDSAAHDPLGYALSNHAPEIGSAGGQFAKAVYQSARLPLRVLEAARYRTAQINGCLICQGFRAASHVDGYLESVGGDASRSIVARGGEAPDEAFYAAVADWQDAPEFSERERLAIEHAERMGVDPHGFAEDAAYWARLHAAFTDAEITELTLAIAAWMAMGRVAHVLELDTVCMEDMLAH